MPADLILAGGRVHTLAKGGERPATHLAVAGGRVLAVGDRRLMELRGPRTRVVELGGAVILPGFNDPHAHVVYHALAAFGADLTGSRGIADLQRRLRRAAARTPVGAWVLGRGYAEPELAEGRPPTRWELDLAVADRPCFVDHRGGHSRVANSAALRAARIGPGTPDPAGGRIGHDASGEPDGRLEESAMRLVADHQPPPPIEQRLAGVERTLRLLASRGITSVGAAVNRGFADDHRVYSRLADSGRLRVRINEFLSWELLPALTELGLGTGAAGELVRFGPVKVFVDGGAAAGTAAVRGSDGPWRTTPAKLTDLVGTASRAGLQVAAHCAGDGAVEAMLDAVAAAPGHRALRHRIEHCFHCPADLRLRAAELGVVVVTQPLYSAFGRGPFSRSLAPGSEADVSPHRALVAAGVPLAFSSDLPVTPDPNPWPGIAAAVADPLQPLTLRQALRAYTFWGAWSSHEERIKGTLETGRMADFQVYDQDPLRSGKEPPLALRPRLVALAGRPVYSRSG